MTDTRSTTTLEYVRVEILEEQSRRITATEVELALMADGTTPGPSDWRAAIWETEPGWRRIAAILVGPGQVELGPGTYTVWYRFTDDAERPARPAGGTLTITE